MNDSLLRNVYKHDNSINPEWDKLNNNNKTTWNDSYQQDIYKSIQTNIEEQRWNKKKQPRKIKSPQPRFRQIYSPLSSITEGKEVSHHK